MQDYGLFMWITILVTILFNFINYIVFSNFTIDLFIGCCGIVLCCGGLITVINLIMDL